VDLFHCLVIQKRTLFEKRACFHSQVKGWGGAYSAGEIPTQLALTDLNLIQTVVMMMMMMMIQTHYTVDHNKEYLL
jgi:hypothetical protein